MLRHTPLRVTIFAAAAAAIHLLAFAPACAQALEVDERLQREVVDPLLMHHEPVRAWLTDAGSLIRYEAGPRSVELRLLSVPQRVQLDAKLRKTRWTYRGELTEDGETGVRLLQYTNSVSKTMYERDEMLSDEASEQAAWFAGHERQFRQIVRALRRQLARASDARSAPLAHRLGRLRGELAEEKHVTVIPGESYELHIRGKREETRGDEIQIGYDLARDRYRMTIVLLATGSDRKDTHREILELTGDGSGLSARYVLTSWKDDTLKTTLSLNSGADDPRYRRKQDAARVLLGLFPRFL
ncbi:MAG: hypothetical protein JSV80_14495 [Acidobacteriota bacterium]|nr:MAG: hypothetical protein JSV80_14495 [Acidobacteriota bacterium]